MTYNKSHWLIDNGNSGFVGHIIYDFVYKHFPLVENKYSNLSLVFLTIVFFILASDINVKKVFSNLLDVIKSLFRRKESNDSYDVETKETMENQAIVEKKSQQFQKRFQKKSKIFQSKKSTCFRKEI